jgi:hypothetical protein
VKKHTLHCKLSIGMYLIVHIYIHSCTSLHCNNLLKVVNVTGYIEIRREYHKTAHPKNRVLCSAFNEVNIQIIQTADMTRERERRRRKTRELARTELHQLWLIKRLVEMESHLGSSASWHLVFLSVALDTSCISSGRL